MHREMFAGAVLLGAAGLVLIFFSDRFERIAGPRFRRALGKTEAQSGGWSPRLWFWLGIAMTAFAALMIVRSLS